MASSTFQLISDRFVKPAVPTPPSLRNYKLSLKDQLMDNIYKGFAIFYPNPDHKHPKDSSEISSLLEEALSKTLVSYYPFAGRLANNNYVDCNDMGARFLEARIGCPMADILEAEDIKAQHVLYPKGIPIKYAPYGVTLLFVQISHFECGGIAISMCLIHKLGDAHTMVRFMNDWTAVARDPGWNPCPRFVGVSLLPPKDDPSFAGYSEVDETPDTVGKVFVFSPEKLTRLKSKAVAEAGLQGPTGVEVVSALLYKCAVNATTVASGSSSPSSLAIPVNLRPLLGLEAGENWMGNLISYFNMVTNDEDVKFSRVVTEIRRQKTQLFERYKTMDIKDLASCIVKEAEEVAIQERSHDMIGIICTSWCKFPLQEADFGWGKPVGLCIPDCSYKNFMHLIDDFKTDGIAAAVFLEKRVMSVFENDPDILEFASLLM